MRAFAVWAFFGVCAMSYVLMIAAMLVAQYNDRLDGPDIW